MVALFGFCHWIWFGVQSFDGMAPERHLNDHHVLVFFDSDASLPWISVYLLFQRVRNGVVESSFDPLDSPVGGNMVDSTVGLGGEYLHSFLSTCGSGDGLSGGNHCQICSWR